MKLLKIQEDDIKSIPSGVQGEDIWLSVEARKKFPFSIEAKNQERVNVWKAYQQARENSGKHQPILFIKRNHHKPLVIIDAEYFMELFK